jgi:anthranilate phosphoribosyltransferase
LTGNSGSADVLEELGVNINLTPDQASKCLEDINLVFIFAQSFHPSMKYAAPLRREIGIRTIFNFLGPLTNPASVTKQIIGTPNKLIAKKIALAAKILKTERIITLSGKSGADEIEIDNDTYIYDSEKNFEEIILQPRIPNKYSSKHLIFKSPKESAKKILECFRLNSVKNINLDLESVLESILMNSAIAISLDKPNNDIDSCYGIAKENLLSGNAMKKLEELINFSNKI